MDKVRWYYGTRFRRLRKPLHRAPNVKRIYLLSDLHMDYPANRQWLHDLCSASKNDDDGNEGGDTMMIVAGDVSHDLEILSWTFRTLKRRYDEVIYTVGNHELWVDKGRQHATRVATTLDADDDDQYAAVRVRSGLGDGCSTSLEKLEKILHLCVEEGVHIGPVIVGGDGSDGDEGEEGSAKGSEGRQPLWVIPLLSWHHQSFDTEPAIECWAGIPSAAKVVADYRRTVWIPPMSSLDDSVARFVDELNDAVLDWEGIIEGIESSSNGDDAPALLTFSHFLPRIELLPEKRYLSLPTLHSCVGSSFLDARLRRLARVVPSGAISDGGETTDAMAPRHIHAFGHTHLSWDATIGGIRYVQVPLAYPREWEQRRKSLEIGAMKGEASENREPVCIWSASPKAKYVASGDDSTEAGNDFTNAGFPSQWLGGWWSKYYEFVERQPHRNTELSPWAAMRYR